MMAKHVAYKAHQRENAVMESY